MDGLKAVPLKDSFLGRRFEGRLRLSHISQKTLDIGNDRDTEDGYECCGFYTGCGVVVDAAG